MSVCDTGCIGCGLCEKTCNQSKCKGCGACAAKCPKKVILAH